MEDKRTRLRKLGLTTPPDKVEAALAHLMGGGSVYGLHQVQKGSPALPLLGKATATKIARLWKQGKLDFLEPSAIAATVIKKAFPVFETDEERRAREKADDAEHAIEVDEGMARWEAAGGPTPQDLDRGEFRFYRLKMVEVAETMVPQSEWCVAGLERAGVPPHEVLRILTERDALHFAAASAVVESSTQESDQPVRWMKDFRGIARYIALHYLVDYCRRYPQAPFELIEAAADLYAKGILEVNNRLYAAGHDILRYEIWRGKEYLDAYWQAIRRYYGNARALRRFQEMLAKAGLSLEQLPGNEGE